MKAAKVFFVAVCFGILALSFAPMAGWDISAWADPPKEGTCPPC